MSGGGGAARPTTTTTSPPVAGGGCSYGPRDEIRRVDIDDPNLVNSPNFNPNFQKVRDIELAVKTTLKGGDGVIASARSDLLHQVVDTPGVQEQAHVVIGEMFGSMPLGGGGDVDIADDKITEAQDDVLTELMSDVPLTGAITAVGGLFLSVRYRNSLFRIGAAGTAGVMAGIAAWEGGLGRITGLSVGACGTLLTALMAGYGYVMAPGVPGVPPVSGPFNASQFEQYLDANIPVGPEAGIIEQIRVGLRSELRNPLNIAYAISVLSCRLVDKICPAGDDFRPLQRFNMQQPAAAGDSNLFTVINAMRDGVAGFLNYLLGLLDIVRKVPYQRVGVVGPEDQSISYNMRLKMTDLIANLFASFRAQSLLTGIIDDKLMNLYLSSLINMIFPSEILFAARTGNNYEAHKELLFLTHKIKDRVIRRWTARGPEYTKDKLLKIFTCFGSRFTELALKMFKDEDPFSCVFVADPSESMQLHLSDSPPEQRLASVQWDWFNKCARGEVPVFEEENDEYDSIANTEWGITSVVLRPDGLARATKTWLSSAAVSAGAATNQQLLNMSEEPAAHRGFAIQHNFPPDPLMFLSNIQAVLRKIQEIVDQKLSQEEMISAIMKAYEDFGDPTLVSQYVKSIVTLSRVWNVGRNKDLFTPSTKKDKNGKDYPIVILNLASISGWKVKDGKLEKVEIPSALLFGLGTKFIQVVGSCVSRIAQQTLALLCSDDAEEEAVMDVQPPPPPPPPPAVVELGGASAEARNAVLVGNIAVCDKHLEMAAGGGVMAEIKKSSESLKVVVAEEQDEAAKEERLEKQQQAILEADTLPPLILIPSHSAVSGGDSEQPAVPFVQQASNANKDRMSPSGTLEQLNLPAKVVEEERSIGKFGVPHGEPHGPPGPSRLGGKSRSKSRKNTKRTRRNKGRKSSKAAKKTQQRRSSRYRRSSRKGRK